MKTSEKTLESIEYLLEMKTVFYQLKKKAQSMEMNMFSPNKYQFIPCCSFSIMRKDHCIIWKDENISNDENSKYLIELSKNSEINVYTKNNVDSAIDLIRKKKYSALKLITNAGANKNGRDLILQARKIIGSNFVCLVFAVSEGHMEWISK